MLKSPLAHTYHRFSYWPERNTTPMQRPRLRVLPSRLLLLRRAAVVISGNSSDPAVVDPPRRSRFNGRVICCRRGARIEPIERAAPRVEGER